MFSAERPTQLRRDRGITQAALAQLSGLSLGAIRNYQQGWRDPPLSKAARLATALNVFVDQPVGEKPEAAAKKPRRPRKGK